MTKALEKEYAEAVRAAWDARGDAKYPHLLRARELRKQIGFERAMAIRRRLLAMCP